MHLSVRLSDRTRHTPKTRSLIPAHFKVDLLTLNPEYSAVSVAVSALQQRY